MHQTTVLDGVLAGAAQLAAGELAAELLPGARSPLTGLGRALIDLTPGPVVDVTVALLEERDKPVLLGSLVAATGGIAVLAARLRTGHRRSAATLLAAQGLVAGAGAASRPDSATGPSLAAGAIGGTAGGAALALVSKQPSSGRRLFVAALTAAAGVAAQRSKAHETRALLARRDGIVLPPPPRPLPAPPPEATFALAGLSPLHTRNEAFYETDVTLPPPVLDLGSWRLRVSGRVDSPLELTFDDLISLGVEERDATLVCVHNPIGGSRIGTARWLGVPLTRLLRRAAVNADAGHLIARSIDGFSASVPLAWIDDEQSAMVAVGMNGEPLPVGHGFPARLLVPGLYGYDANTKWLTEIELVAGERVVDYWTQRGWPPDPARVRPSARIDVPTPRARVAVGRTLVAGVAWAPPEGVDQVQVSVDGGPWQTAELAAELDPAAWRLWRSEVDLGPGQRELRVRATGRGSGPADDMAAPYPYGAAGCHTVTVTGGAPPPPQPIRVWEETRALVGERTLLATQGLRAWARHGWPRPRFPHTSA